eukprot:tig00020816_g14139.t1
MSSLFVEGKVRPGRLSKAYTAEDFAQANSWALALTRRFRLLPKSIAPFIEGHMTYQLAMAHMGYGAWAKALACLERAKEELYDRYPAYFSPRQRRIVDLGEAIAACRERLGADGGRGAGKADRLCSTSHAGLNRYEDAERELVRAAAAAEDDPSPRVKRGLVLFQLGQREKALQELRGVVRQFPKAREARAALVAALWDAGKSVRPRPAP